MSIAIIFPLVFTIRGSFRRREKALQYLSEFISTLKTLKYYFMSNTNLSEDYKNNMEAILIEINTKVLNHLIDKKSTINELDETINKMYCFISENNELLPRSLKDKIFRFMKDMHVCIENLYAIHMHRTPVSLKAYCELFIYIFPCIYAPVIIYNLGEQTPIWVAYFIVIITEFILISLYNIQNQLEYPFDNIGLDDINLNNFRIDR